MSRVRRSDPARRDRHDYVLTDGATMRDLGVFAHQEGAIGWLKVHWPERRGTVTVLTVEHPDGCGCPEAPGRGRRPALASIGGTR